MQSPLTDPVLPTPVGLQKVHVTHPEILLSLSPKASLHVCVSSAQPQVCDKASDSLQTGHVAGLLAAALASLSKCHRRRGTCSPEPALSALPRSRVVQWFSASDIPVLVTSERLSRPSLLMECGFRWTVSDHPFTVNTSQFCPQKDLEGQRALLLLPWNPIHTGQFH